MEISELLLSIKESIDNMNQSSNKFAINNSTIESTTTTTINDLNSTISDLQSKLNEFKSDLESTSSEFKSDLENYTLKLNDKLSEINNHIHTIESRSCFRKDVYECKWVIYVGDVYIRSDKEFSRFRRWVYTKLFNIKFLRYDNGGCINND